MPDAGDPGRIRAAAAHSGIAAARGMSFFGRWVRGIVVVIG